MLAAGERRPDVPAEVAHHLGVCPECLEEFEALLDAALAEG